jgi:hypothetical protein
MDTIGKSVDECCEDKVAFEIDLDAPLAPKNKIDDSGLITVYFN